MKNVCKAKRRVKISISIASLSANEQSWAKRKVDEMAVADEV